MVVDFEMSYLTHRSEVRIYGIGAAISVRKKSYITSAPLCQIFNLYVCYSLTLSLLGVFGSAALRGRVGEEQGWYDGTSHLC